jgi:PAS domain S-box-containing protein
MEDHKKNREELLAELTELRQREAQWRSAIANSPNVIAIVDSAGTLRFLNRTQPGTTMEETIGKKVFDFTRPEFHDTLRQSLERVFDTGETCCFESVGSGPNGGNLWYETYMGPIVVDDRVVAATIIANDINERKLAEAGLRNSERTLRTLIDASLESILLLDTERTVLIANETAARRLGTTVADIVGQRTHTLLPPEVFAQRGKHFQEVIRTGQPVRFEDQRAGRYYDIAVHPVFDEQGKVAAVAILSIDRTDRKRAEQALKQAHNELERKVQERTVELTKVNEELAIFQKFAETSGQGFSMAAPDGHITYVNPALSRMLGEERPEEVIGRHLSTFFSEESNRRGEQEIQPALNQRGYWEGELPMLSRHGKTIPTWHNTSVIRDEKGSPLRLAVVITDITERKQAQEALQREHRTLKHLLQSSDHERQLIAYEIHDGLAQQLAGAIMQFQTYTHLKDKKSELAAKAYDAGMTMLQQGHFEARRLIAGVRPPVLDESGVVAAVGHLVNEQSRLRGPDIEYRSRVAFDRLAPILENAIYRIAQEGLANACQHSKSEKVRVSLVQREDFVQIEIRDWGIGFDTRSVLENRYGLVGIRQRVRLLGGKCSIRSKAGKGTRITVELPVVVRE